MISSPLFCTHCGAANLAQVAFCYACGQAIQTPESAAALSEDGPLRAGTRLKQRYKIVQQIGTGGFGAVYQAEDTDLGQRLVAVKEMSQHNLSSQEIAEATRAFKQEALLLADLMHEHLPRIYDHFTENGRWYLVMDYIRGETLENELERASGHRLSLDEALDIALQLGAVLNYLHTRTPPIIFRDLKPSNVILTPEKRVFLIDFGIARHFKPGQAKDTMAFGSPGYAPPEQYGKAQTTPRADIYSLGAILHEMLTGTDPSLSPFRFAPLALNAPALQELLTRMLELDENKRPATMAGVSQELKQIKEQPQLVASSTGQVLARSIVTPRVRKPASGPNVLIYEGHASKVHSVGWSSNSLYLASASDEIVRIWDAATGSEISKYQGHFARIVSMAWSPKNMQIASLGQDNNLHIWDANTGYETQTDAARVVPQIGRLRLLAWSPNARLLALAGDGRTVEILDVIGNKHHKTLQAHALLNCNSLAWSPDGQCVAVSSANTVYIWDVHTGSIQRTYNHSAQVSALAWSPDSFYMASCGSGRVLQFWMARTGELVSMWTGEPLDIDALCWSPGGRLVASGGIKGDLLLWKFLASPQRHLRTWSVQESMQIDTYAGHTGRILSVAWSPDGRYLATGSADETVRIWRAPVGQP